MSQPLVTAPDGSLWMQVSHGPPPFPQAKATALPPPPPPKLARPEDHGRKLRIVLNPRCSGIALTSTSSVCLWPSEHSHASRATNGGPSGRSADRSASWSSGWSRCGWSPAGPVASHQGNGDRAGAAHAFVLGGPAGRSSCLDCVSMAASLRFCFTHVMFYLVNTDGICTCATSVRVVP